MLLHRPLLTITPSVDGDVLMVLARADSEFTAPDIHRLLGRWSVQGIRKALDRLVSQGAVAVRESRAASFYRLNREHLAAPAIIELASLRLRFYEKLEESFEAWAPKPAVAAVFGSAVRSEMTVSSDIDIFIARPDAIEAEHPDWVAQMSDLVQAASNWTGNDVRVFELPLSEARQRLAEGDEVLRSIGKEGIAVYGDLDLVRRGR